MIENCILHIYPNIIKNYFLGNNRWIECAILKKIVKYFLNKTRMRLPKVFLKKFCAEN